MVNDNSILTSTKKVLGISEEDTSFDLDITMHINTVFSNLVQMGVGNPDFVLVDKTQVWTDFCTMKNSDQIRTYTYLKVRIIFDPSTSSIVMDALKETAKELEWRLYTAAQGGKY